MSRSMHGHRETLGIEDARLRLHEALRSSGAGEPLSGELVDLPLCRGRVTAAPIYALVSSPHYEAAAMDGFAVRGDDTAAATDESPVTLYAGRDCLPVDTGDPLLPGFDAVVMIEVVRRPDPGSIEIRVPVAAGQHIRPIGEDIVSSDMILPINHRLRPVDLGAAAAAGHAALLVRRRPRVAIIPTGSELVVPGVALRIGDIVEYNSIVLAAMAEEWGAETRRFPIQHDNLDTICGALREALAWADIVAINAGSSAGSEDFTASAIGRLGQVLVHGMAIKPGHPVIIGIADRKPVLGIPGYPVSAALTFELLAAPLVHGLQGLLPLENDTIDAVITQDISSPPDIDDFVRVRMGNVNGQMLAGPLRHGAGVLTSLVEADGIVHIPRFSIGYLAGDVAEVRMLRRRADIEQTILMAGGNDPSLKLLANWLREHRSRQTLSVSTSESLEGLLALRNGQVHLTGCHILDEETGEFSVPYVWRLLPGVSAVVITLAHRMRGLLVRQGNPLGIASAADLERVDVRPAGMRRGAGTGASLVRGLRAADIDPARVAIHDKAETAQLGAAAAVAGGSADVGVGTLAAAGALGLDFVPLYEERYDLVMTAEMYASPLLQDVLQALTSSTFRAAVRRLGGYRVDDMGKVVLLTR